MTDKTSSEHPIPNDAAALSAALEVLARYCRGFIDKPTTRENLPELLERICESDIRRDVELSKLRDAISRNNEPEQNPYGFGELIDERTR